MSTDLNTILALKRELDSYADNLRAAKSDLIRYKDSLDVAWNATEIGMIDDAIDEVNRKLNRTADEMNDISSDILKAYQQIEEERIAREQAEREKQEQLAREQAEQRAREEEQRVREEQKSNAEKARQEAGKQSSMQLKGTVTAVTSFFSWLFRR